MWGRDRQFYRRSSYLCPKETLAGLRKAAHLRASPTTHTYTSIKRYETNDYKPPPCSPSALAGSTAQAQTLTKATSYGTHAVSRPVMIDSVDVHNQKFSLGSLLKTSYKTEGLKAHPSQRHPMASSPSPSPPAVPARSPLTPSPSSAKASPRAHSSSMAVLAMRSMMARRS